MTAPMIHVGGIDDFYRYILKHFPPPEWCPVAPETPTKEEEKKEMATALVDGTVQSLNVRIEELEAELVLAKAARDCYTPEEPLGESPVIRFVKYNLSYTFAAIRAYTNELGEGVWFITQDGRRSSAQGHAPKTWAALLGWIGERNWHRIEVLG